MSARRSRSTALDGVPRAIDPTDGGRRLHVQIAPEPPPTGAATFILHSIVAETSTRRPSGASPPAATSSTRPLGPPRDRSDAAGDPDGQGAVDDVPHHRARARLEHVDVPLQDGQLLERVLQGALRGELPVTCKVAVIALVPLLATCAPNVNDHAGPVCTSGTQRCDGNAYESCNDSGTQWVIDDDCATHQQVCVLGTGCRLNCVPNQLACGGDGEDIVLCSADGGRLDTVGRCDPEMGQLCTAGTCVDSCTQANQTRLRGLRVLGRRPRQRAVVSIFGSRRRGAAVRRRRSPTPTELPATRSLSRRNDCSCSDSRPRSPRVAQAHLAGRRRRRPGDHQMPPREVDGSISAPPQRRPLAPGSRRLRVPHPLDTRPRSSRTSSTRSTTLNVFFERRVAAPACAGSRTPTTSSLPGPRRSPTRTIRARNAGIDLRTFLTIVGQESATYVTVTLATDIVGGGPVPDRRPAIRSSSRSVRTTSSTWRAQASTPTSPAKPRLRLTTTRSPSSAAARPRTSR